MSGTRVQVDLFFKGMSPKQVNQTFPQLLPAVKAAKAKASKINEGKENEEVTIIANYHICRHDEDKPCDSKIEL